GRLLPPAAGLLVWGRLAARGLRISGEARVEDLELDARAPSRVEDLVLGQQSSCGGAAGHVTAACRVLSPLPPIASPSFSL
ncbi:unnamed protein product, partial [Urochloa humidicola]